MEIDKPKVLVLDANERSALAVTRSLGHSGRYLVSTADSVTSSLAGSSRYSQSYLSYPDPNRYPMDFVNWVCDAVSRHSFQLIMPTTEVTSQLLLKHQCDLPGVKLPFASYDRVMKIANKISLAGMAEKCGVSVPRSQNFDNVEQVVLDELQFPLVIKPALSRIFWGDQWIQTKVWVVRNLCQWNEALKSSPYLYKSPFMLQEFIPGYGSGVFCLYNNGQPVQFFAHQRLREKPPEGGVSVLSRSVPVDETLKDAAEKLLSSVEWHGVAMVEFRISENGHPYLMEINTRFWGSLQLAVDSGIDFPLMLANIHFGYPIEGKHEYRYDQRLRWLLGDVDSLYLFLKQPHSFGRKLARIAEFLSIRFCYQKHEINRFDDLKPAWIELKQYLRALLR